MWTLAAQCPPRLSGPSFWKAYTYFYKELGLGCGSVVEPLPSTREALGSIPGTATKRKQGYVAVGYVGVPIPKLQMSN